MRTVAAVKVMPSLKTLSGEKGSSRERREPHHKKTTARDKKDECCENIPVLVLQNFIVLKRNQREREREREREKEREKERENKRELFSIFLIGNLKVRTTFNV